MRIKITDKRIVIIPFDLLPAATGCNVFTLTDREASIVRRVVTQTVFRPTTPLVHLVGALYDTISDVELSTWLEEAETLVDKLTGGPSMDQAANTVLAGPVSGADAAPAFRALVGYDLPGLSFMGCTPGGTLTIAAGVITVTASQHGLDTEGGASSDNLDTINPLVAGRLLVLYSVNSAHDVVLRHAAGNIVIRTGADLTLATSNRPTILVGLPSYWAVLSDYGL